MIATLEQPNMLTPKSVKEAITQTYPSMPRYKKIKLATNIIPAYTRATEVAQLLGEGSLNEPFPQNCDIDDDYLILRDENNNSIADVYVGSDQKLTGHVVFQSGSQLDEHGSWLLKGELEADGFIAKCNCSACLRQRTDKAANDIEAQLIGSTAYTYFIPSISKLKVTGASDKLIERLQDSSLVADSAQGKPKVIEPRPMKREGNSSSTLD